MNKYLVRLLETLRLSVDNTSDACKFFEGGKIIQHAQESHAGTWNVVVYKGKRIWIM